MRDGNPQLWKFVTESNAIEGIFRQPGADELAAHEMILSLSKIDVPDLCDFVKVICGRKLRDKDGMELRDQHGMNVRIGSHYPPKGGFRVVDKLVNILEMAHGDKVHPYIVHCEYEMLHPFMDGNGRSGRALWLWQMLRRGADPYQIPFLQWWYYLSLDRYRD